MRLIAVVWRKRLTTSGPEISWSAPQRTSTKRQSSAKLMRVAIPTLSNKRSPRVRKRTDAVRP
jgi:hypothetical protein